MKKQTKTPFLVCVLFCMPLVSFAASGPDPTPGDRGQIVYGAADAVIEPVLDKPVSVNPPVSPSVLAPTPWGAPVLVSPSAGARLNHYPRATTLAWKPVTGAISYVVERAYYDGSWRPYSPVTVTGVSNTSYTFDFVGDQPGRWRVKAYNGSSYSTYSGWWTFSYTTKAQMSTPILISPQNDVVFSHYPRTTTLTWKMAPGATGYRVEIMYCMFDRITCWPYSPVVITDRLRSYYTFDFVGAQPGKWRVTALGAPTYLDSAPSGWRWFSFDI